MSKWRDHGNGAAIAFRHERDEALDLFEAAPRYPRLLWTESELVQAWQVKVDELLDRCRDKVADTTAQRVREVTSTAGQLIVIATAIDSLRQEIAAARTRFR